MSNAAELNVKEVDDSGHVPSVIRRQLNVNKFTVLVLFKPDLY